MKTEAIKMNGHYFIPLLDKIGINMNKITIEIDDEILDKQILQKSKTYKKLEEHNKKLGGDLLTELKLQNYPKDFTYRSLESDEDLLFEVLREKHDK